MAILAIYAMLAIAAVIAIALCFIFIVTLAMRKSNKKGMYKPSIIYDNAISIRYVIML